MRVSSPSGSARVDRTALIEWFVRTRARSRELFDFIHDDAYYTRPISLRHPIVFYEGHLAAFSVNTLIKKALGGQGIDGRLETLFARGIDPEDQRRAATRASDVWPERQAVREYARASDEAIVEALIAADLDRPGHPLLDRAEAVYAIIEHEAMHQETLLYMWHRLPYELKKAPANYRPITDGAAPEQMSITVPAGRATLGADRDRVAFGWDNEFPRMGVSVPAFAIDKHDVTNAEYLDFIEAGGYDDERWWSEEDRRWLASDGVRHPLFWERGDEGWVWRGMFGEVPLPPAWPVYVSQAEAVAYARWRGKRLPTEAEFHRAAFGASSGEERPAPWGDARFDATRGNADFQSWDPIPAGCRPAGQSAWGIEDLAGNGWEWTSTIFEGFPGFTPMASYPEYSADFFDGQHYVMKGASPATARELLRPSFRNWFRPRYPYVYATFRCVRGL